MSRLRLRYQLLDSRPDVDKVYLDETIDFAQPSLWGPLSVEDLASRHGEYARLLALAGIPTHMIVTDPDGDIDPVVVVTPADPAS